MGPQVALTVLVAYLVPDPLRMDKNLSKAGSGRFFRALNRKRVSSTPTPQIGYRVLILGVGVTKVPLLFKVYCLPEPQRYVNRLPFGLFTSLPASGAQVGSRFYF